MTQVHLLGTSMTRFAAHPELSLKQLARQAFDEALADAGLQAHDIEFAAVGNATQGALQGQHAIRGQILLRECGLERIPALNVENACATGSTALYVAAQQIRSGAVDCALALGAEKMVIDDKARALALFDSGWDIETPQANLREICGRYFDPSEVFATEGRRRSMFMDLYGVMARHHMEAFGTTREQIAAVAEKNHWHSTFNPKAQFRQAFTLQQILDAPQVSGPLTVPMCAPLSDGAAAAILVSDRLLRKLDARRALRLLASVLRTGSRRDPRDFAHHLCHLAARDAYAQAGIGPGDIDVAEVHDAAAFGEILQSECLGFCAFGEGGALAQSGATRLGGRIPINPSGGLECKGHPLGATGLGQLHELALQLRGEAGARQVKGARHAIAENGGGLLGVEEAVTSITILGKE